jgi:hypothetical protein
MSARFAARLHDFLQLFLTSDFPKYFFFNDPLTKLPKFSTTPTPTPYVDPIPPNVTQGHPRVGRGPQFFAFGLDLANCHC